MFQERGRIYSEIRIEALLPCHSSQWASKERTSLLSVYCTQGRRTRSSLLIYLKCDCFFTNLNIFCNSARDGSFNAQSFSTEHGSTGTNSLNANHALFLRRILIAPFLNRLCHHDITASTSTSACIRINCCLHLAIPLRIV